MQRILLYLFIASIGLSCQRRNTIISGKVFDECSKAPIRNATVELWTGEKFSSSHSAKMEVQQTLADGSFYFHFHTGFMSEHYWVQCNGDVSDYVGKRETEAFNLYCSEPKLISFLDLNIKNNTPFDNNDSIFIEATKPNSSYPASHNHYSFKGQSIDTIVRITVDGCPPKLVNLNWTVRKNNTTSSFSNTVTCVNGSTSSFLINY